MKTVNCGDWHLGWGFGGHDKVGKLSTENCKTFTWKGNSQGRHGNVWNRGAKAKLELVDGDVVVLEQQGSIPVRKELLKGIEELKAKFNK